MAAKPAKFVPQLSETTAYSLEAGTFPACRWNELVNTRAEN